MSKLNILSIDFDYFQIVDEHTMVNHYPDGHDFNSELSSMVWSTHYAWESSEKELMKVKVDKTKIGKIKTILKFGRDACMMNMITNSHVHINQLLEMLKDRADGFNIYNLDMHHDMFDTEIENGEIVCKGKLSCGNWASYAKKNFNSKIIWIKNLLSDTLFPLDLPDEQTLDISILDGVKFDAVFLCRSDIWLPPHLDAHFNRLKDYMRNELYESTYMDPQVDKPRNIVEQAKEMRKVYETMHTEFNREVANG